MLLYVVLAFIAVLAADRDRRVLSGLAVSGERIAVRVYALHLGRRRARALAWINEWRSQRGMAQQCDWRKGVRNSREHGIIACNLEVVAYGDGQWIDHNGRSGRVPGYVAAFARDFDEGLFPALIGRVVPIPADVMALAGARSRGGARAAIVA